MKLGFGFVGLIGVALTTACAATEAPNNGGRTNWLSECNRDADCGDLECFDNMCTRACDRSSSCADLGSNATCESDNDRNGICSLRCDREEDCSSRGMHLSCDGASCVANVASESPTGRDPEPDSSIEAGIPTPSGSEPEPTDTVGPGEPPATNAPVGEPTIPCVGPENPASAYECLEVVLPCPCDEPDVTRCVEEDSRWIAFHCESGEWQPTSNSTCVPDSAECFSPTENVDRATSGELRGCSCEEDDEVPVETCARTEDIEVPMWCLGGAWRADPTAPGCTLAWDLCSGSQPGPDPFIDGGPCPERLDEVSQRTPEAILNEGLLDGEPGCERGCGYRYDSYVENSPDYNGWVYAPEIECPLDSSQCLSLGDALRATPLSCESDSDCTLLDGVTNCENVFEPPVYLDSSRLSDGVRAERAELWEQILAKGCGNSTGFDGPVLEAGCIDGLCDLRTIWYCGMALPEEDAGAGDPISSADASVE
jgi:hypothetical protein